MKISVLGAGSWGTAIASLLANKDYEVSLWHRSNEFVQKLSQDKENKKYLPGISLDSITFTDNLEESISDSQIIILGVPSHAVRSTCELIKGFVKSEQLIINIAKGLEEGTYLRLSQVINDVLSYNEVFILSGPSHAEEVAKKIPTTLVVSGDSRQKCEYLQDIFSTKYFRVYTNPDIVGVELGGALKNVIALGAGISDGLGYGDNSKAALITRGIVEISRLGKLMGAQAETFAGLSGIGDLIVTCTSMHSRNRRAGILLGQGIPLNEVLVKIGMIVEGVKATKIAYELSKIHSCDMPIVHGMYEILYNHVSAKDVVTDMMTRTTKHEIEEINSLMYFGWK